MQMILSIFPRGMFQKALDMKRILGEGVDGKCTKDKGHDLWYWPGPLAEFRQIPMCCLTYRSRQQQHLLQYGCKLWVHKKCSLGTTAISGSSGVRSAMRAASQLPASQVPGRRPTGAVGSGMFYLCFFWRSNLVLDAFFCLDWLNEM